MFYTYENKITVRFTVDIVNKERLNNYFSKCFDVHCYGLCKNTIKMKYFYTFLMNTYYLTH